MLEPMRSQPTLRERFRNGGVLVQGLAVSAAILLISIGLCGANLIAVSIQSRDPAGVLVIGAFAELAGILLGAAGVVIFGLALFIRYLLNRKPRYPA